MGGVSALAFNPLSSFISFQAFFISFTSVALLGNGPLDARRTRYIFAADRTSSFSESWKSPALGRLFLFSVFGVLLTWTSAPESLSSSSVVWTRLEPAWGDDDLVMEEWSPSFATCSLYSIWGEGEWGARLSRWTWTSGSSDSYSSF